VVRFFGLVCTKETTAGEIEDDIDNNVTKRHTPQKSSRFAFKMQTKFFFVETCLRKQAVYSIATRRSLDPSDPAGSRFREKYAFRAQNNKATFTVPIGNDVLYYKEYHSSFSISRRYQL
jgi:hypothetical protein